jgi:hypothetical protein
MEQLVFSWAAPEGVKPCIEVAQVGHWRFNPSLVLEIKTRYAGDMLDALELSPNDQYIGLYCNGATLSDILQDAALTAGVMWKEFVECPIETLTEDALELRNRLKARLTFQEQVAFEYKLL